jgi:outer membrane lipoprotein carrier protein
VKFHILSLAVLLGFPPTAPDGIKQVIARVEARYRSAKTLQATFLERYSENGRVVRSESGTAYFRRPGKMRWEYVAPEKNLFLVDGKKAWFYVPADHTVTRVPARQSSDFRTPLALLAGEMKLSRVCSKVQQAKDATPEGEGNLMLSCTLRGSEGAESNHQPDSQAPTDISQVLFEVDPRSGDLARILVYQEAGVEVEFRFANWRFNVDLPASMFRFDVPTGVAIVNGELPGGQSPAE